jgi:1-acyl-sn-glycerol-3-phosphate acyltransferase
MAMLNNPDNLPNFSKANHPLAYGIIKTWIGGLFQMAGGIHIVMPNSYAGPGKKIETANHDSWLDPFLLGVVNAEPMFALGKDELAKKFPYVGKWFLGPYCNTTFISRTGRDHDILGEMGEKADKEDVAVLSFITGTRRDDAMPKTGVAHMAIKSSTEERPTAILPVGHSLSVWKPGRPVQVIFGEPIYCPGNARELKGAWLKNAREYLTDEAMANVEFLKTQAIVLDAMRAGRKFRITTSTYEPSSQLT